MSESWLVLGGWALDPRILTPIFGDASTYVDVNLLMPRLVAGETLRPDWREIALQEIAPLLAQPRLPLAGWSTGAIVALALIDKIAPPRSRLLAGTPSFCARNGFVWGADPRSVDALKRQLRRNREATLQAFFARCGLRNPGSVVCPYPTDILVAGLDFLQHASLLPCTRPGCPVEVIHGADDVVVPLQAGEFLAEAMGTGIDVRDGGHAFFSCQNTSSAPRHDEPREPGV